jgi:hypothetical protein
MFSCVYSISVSSGPSTNLSVSVCTNRSSEFTIPVDGSVLFIIDQPESDTLVDLSSIPTHTFPTVNNNVLAFLLCSPHVSIQTRQVRAAGDGNLTLLEKPQPSQGNIDLYQANYLLSYVLQNLATSSGPTTYPGQLGTDLVERLIFDTNITSRGIIASGGPISLSPGDGYSIGGTPVSGPAQGSSENGYLLNGYPPAPITNITAVYKQVIQSAMKVFLSGGIATANVTGGYTEEQMVFTSSLGHVVTSVILFVFLTTALVAAQFRKRRAAFTFVNVAAALADSDVSEKCVEMTQFKAGTTGEGKVLKLVTSGDGQLSCAYQSIV